MGRGRTKKLWYQVQYNTFLKTRVNQSRELINYVTSERANERPKRAGCDPMRWANAMLWGGMWDVCRIPTLETG